jgi:MoaA/NifB/PqqE/SkfB family radical SAM enzyme
MDSPVDKELSGIRRGVNFPLVNKNISLLKDLSNRPFIVFTVQEANINRIFDIAQYAHLHNCHIIFNAVRRDIGIEAFVKIVKENYDLIVEQFQKAKELYEHSQLQCIYPDQLAGIEIKVEKPVITHGTMTSCPALTTELCILFDGTVTPCNMFNPYVYGNIFNQSLDKIWNGKNREEFLVSHKSFYYCKNCAFIGG